MGRRMRYGKRKLQPKPVVLETLPLCSPLSLVPQLPDSILATEGCGGAEWSKPVGEPININPVTCF